MDTSKWKSFKLEELFEISGSKTTQKSKLEQIGNGIYPYVTTQATTNGIAGYYDFQTEKGNCLTVDSAVLGICFYQEKDFSASDHVEILRPKFQMSQEIAIFLTAIINKLGTILCYGYDKKRSQTALKQESILLPIDKQDKPDWEFMQETIKQTQKQVLATLKLYEKLQTMKSNGGGYRLLVLSYVLAICQSINPSLMRLLCK